MRRVRRNKRPRSRSAGTIANPTIAIVGAGRVGCALGRRLHEKGWRVGSVTTRSMRSAREARRRIGSGTPQAGVSEPVLAADIILISTPDRAIGDTAEALARLGESNPSIGTRAAKQQTKSRGKPWQGKIVLHTSGALASDVLRPLALRGAATGSLHPLQTFSAAHDPFFGWFGLRDRGQRLRATHSAPDLPRFGVYCRGTPAAQQGRVSCWCRVGGRTHSGAVRGGGAHADRGGLFQEARRRRTLAAHAANAGELRARGPARGRERSPKVSLDWPIEPRRFWSDRTASASFARLPEGIPGSV